MLYLQDLSLWDRSCYDSLTNPCSDKLYLQDITEDQTALPSPDELKGKVIIKVNPLPIPLPIHTHPLYFSSESVWVRILVPVDQTALPSPDELKGKVNIKVNPLPIPLPIHTHPLYFSWESVWVRILVMTLVSLLFCNFFSSLRDINGYLWG